MRIPLHRVFRGRRNHRDGRPARKKLVVPVVALALLATVFQPLVSPLPASASVRDYRPATYNMQGGGTKWTDDIPRILRGGYNVIALQEAGPTPPGRLEWTSRLLTGNNFWAGWRVQRYRWRPGGQNHDWAIYYVRTDFGGNRVNMAILTDRPVTHVHVVSPAVWGNNGLPVSRPAIGITTGNTNFYSVHALANGGGDGAQLLQNIAGHAGTHPWAAMGDWNREPWQLAINPGQHRYVSNQATHQGGRELDYMVSNERIPGYGGVAQGYGSDHAAVMFRLLAAHANVQLLNSRDGGKALGVDNSINGTRVVNGGKNDTVHWHLEPMGNGLYSIVNATNHKCWSDYNGTIIQYTCNGAKDQQFDLNTWLDNPDQIQFRPANRSNQCVGDDGWWGWGTALVTTASCSGGETRFNTRFDYDPGPNAELLVL